MKLEKLIGDNHPNERKTSAKLPILDDNGNSSCNFYGYNIENLMKETSELRKIITKIIKKMSVFRYFIKNSTIRRFVQA